MTTLRQGATAAYRWLTFVFFVGVVVQFFLAGLGVFARDADSLDPHRGLGYGLQAIALVLLLLLLVARPTRHVFVPYLVLIVLAFVQPFLVGGNQLIGGLHGLNALAVFAIAGMLAHRAFRREITAR